MREKEREIHKNHRRASAIRYLAKNATGVVEITPGVLAEYFKMPAYKAHKIVANTLYRDPTYLNPSWGLTRIECRHYQNTHIQHGVHKYPTRGWDVKDLYKYFEYSEDEFGFPLTVTTDWLNQRVWKIRFTINPKFLVEAAMLEDRFNQPT